MNPRSEATRRAGLAGAAALVALAGLIWITQLRGGQAATGRRVPTPQQIAAARAAFARDVAHGRRVNALARVEAAAHPRDIRVATFNVNGTQSDAGRAWDLHELLATPSNVLGLQEAQDSHAQLTSALAARRWGLYQPAAGGTELAIAWDRRRFAQVAAGRDWLMHDGEGHPLTRDPFPARYTINVVLRDRVTGERVSVYDTHVNQHIDGGGHPLTHEANWHFAARHLAWLERKMAGDTAGVVVLVGDLNIDARADQSVHDPAFPYETLGVTAISNWQALGTSGLPTHGSRFIDYVDLSRASFARWAFADDSVLTGYHSDHHPVLATVRRR